jgi:hypothetical protein
VEQGHSAGVDGAVTTTEETAQMSTILLVILILLLIGALPTWPYSSGWGYYPSGGFTILLIILIVLLVSGRI